jgi:hypothetical protein
MIMKNLDYVHSQRPMQLHAHNRTVSRRRDALFLFMLPHPAPAVLKEEGEEEEDVDTCHSRAPRPVIKAAWLEDRQL